MRTRTLACVALNTWCYRFQKETVSLLFSRFYKILFSVLIFIVEKISIEFSSPFQADRMDAQRQGPRGQGAPAPLRSLQLTHLVHTRGGRQLAADQEGPGRLFGRVRARLLCQPGCEPYQVRLYDDTENKVSNTVQLCIWF